MTSGETLYLLLCFGVVAVFALTLAFQSWKQKR